MDYFAYGPNLNQKQMLERCPDSKPRSTAILPNFKVVFLGWSRQWRGGVISIKPAQGAKVRGAIYEISERDLRRLDSDEGYPGNATKLNVTVFDADDEPIQAITYLKTGQLEETRPSTEYLAIIQQGYRDWHIV